MSSYKSIKRCICILTNKITDVKEKIILGIYDQVYDDTDIWLMVDKSEYDEKTEVFIKDKKCLEFTWDEFKTSEKYTYFSDHHEKDYIGNCQLPFIKFYEEHKEYDYYMFYEDDLLITMNIVTLYNEIFNNIGLKDVYFFDQPHVIKNTNWHWITDERSDYRVDEKCSPNKQQYIMLHLYILSNKALSCLYRENLSGNWIGHHELMVPSILATNEFEFAYYNSLFSDYIFEYQENVINTYFNSNTPLQRSYYHPIKNIELYNKINSMIMK